MGNLKNRVCKDVFLRFTIHNCTVKEKRVSLKVTTLNIEEKAK